MVKSVVIDKHKSSSILLKILLIDFAQNFFIHDSTHPQHIPHGNEKLFRYYFIMKMLAEQAICLGLPDLNCLLRFLANFILMSSNKNEF